MRDLQLTADFRSKNSCLDFPLVLFQNAQHGATTKSSSTTVPCLKNSPRILPWCPFVPLWLSRISCSERADEELWDFQLGFFPCSSFRTDLTLCSSLSRDSSGFCHQNRTRGCWSWARAGSGWKSGKASPLGIPREFPHSRGCQSSGSVWAMLSGMLRVGFLGCLGWMILSG